MPLSLESPLDELRSLPARVASSLRREGVVTLRQVLDWLPFRHEDRTYNAQPLLSASPFPSCHQLLVLRVEQRRFGGRGGMVCAHCEVIASGAMSARLTLRWFGVPYIKKILVEGQTLFAFGKIKEQRGQWVMDHPEFEIADSTDAEPGLHTGRITPIYRLRSGINQKQLRTAIWHALEVLQPEWVPDRLPKPRADGKFAGCSRFACLRELHFPADARKLSQARRYLALEEFTLLQLRVLNQRQQRLEQGGIAHRDWSLADALLKALPFTLTQAQQRCLEEIRADMQRPCPMNRLLHGDVGSGKTVLAFLAMAAAVARGHQAVLMAPTQILAEQHYAKARLWLEPLGIPLRLRTGSRSEQHGADLLAAAPTSKAIGEMVIGTHALLHDLGALDRLGLVVIDEQHKFGVAQRARLIRAEQSPDVLVMTATPIPRTLTLTLYGELDVSTIDQRPAQRGGITTRIRTPKCLEQAAEFVLTQLREGRQAYLVFPLIEESEKSSMGAATKGHKQWQKLLPGIQVGLLHGRMSGEQKEKVMREFHRGEIQALVSTTVIEVGVDVPNASIMIIHDADRFGLAALHQLRGRIGRGTHQSYCILLTGDEDPEAQEKLRIMEQTHDGFVISEEDLRRRGPGDVLGQAQSGSAPLRFGDFLADTRLISLARTLAQRILSRDPKLEEPRWEDLRQVLLQAPAQGASAMQ